MCACGNRGKQDSYTNETGETVHTGDAPSRLVDQKAAARFVKYNILLGNLPGSVDYWVSTGGSGGGAHAASLRLPPIILIFMITRLKSAQSEFTGMRTAATAQL